MMKKLHELFADLRRDESGTVVIEYTMIVSLVAMGIFTAIQLMSTNLDAMLMSMANAF